MGGWARGARGIRQDTCWDEHWVFYVGDESLESSSEIIIALYANLDVNLKKIKINLKFFKTKNKDLEMRLCCILQVGPTCNGKSLYTEEGINIQKRR